MKEFKNKIKSCNLWNNSILIFSFLKQFYIFIFINLFLIAGCGNLKKNENISICSTTKLPCIDSNEYVLLITNRGKIKLELYGRSVPITVGNFIDFVEKGKYNKTVFNRVIKNPYPFIIRGGENISIENRNNSKDIKTGKKRYIPLEIKLKNKILPIYGKEINEFSQINNIELKHKRSYLSMARAKMLDSASSEFYILLKSLPELDGRYAVFGKVISGMNVVDTIEEDDFIIEAKRINY